MSVSNETRKRINFRDLSESHPTKTRYKNASSYIVTLNPNVQINEELKPTEFQQYKNYIIEKANILFDPEIIRQTIKTTNGLSTNDVLIPEPQVSLERGTKKKVLHFHSKISLNVTTTAKGSAFIDYTAFKAAADKIFGIEGIKIQFDRFKDSGFNIEEYIFKNN